MKILGIDPGINNLAFALLEIKNDFYELKDWQTLNTKKCKNITEKLTYLFNNLKDFVEKSKPDIIGIEESFTKTYSKAGSRLSQAQAIALLVAGLYNIPVKLLNPSEIKKFLTQHGKAKKEEIFHILNLFFKEGIINYQFDLNPDSHKIDALAIALILALEINHQNALPN
uniref:Holliday junction nuclease RuvC n=1 Tax=Thermodesulfobacterium geofontis TaxID=1295609 RepID=A0A7V4JQ16_9BACT